MAEMKSTRDGDRREVSEPAGRKVCERCSGTGLICGSIPVIAPGACCVDYANAICPDCGGSGASKG